MTVKQPQNVTKYKVINATECLIYNLFQAENFDANDYKHRLVSKEKTSKLEGNCKRYSPSNYI